MNKTGNGLRPRPIKFFDLLSILRTASILVDLRINMRNHIDEPDQANIYNGEFDPGSG